ncbi:hypothetical protein KKA47_06435 [bacterium]|nr:hypothetical protein [bacterium]
MIEKISTIISQLPPNWMSRVIATSGNIGNSDEIRKLLGEPLPKVVNLNELPPEVQTFFAVYGMLERIRKRLKSLTGKKGKKILPAKNTIASVDEEENIYVGVEFLERYKDEEGFEDLLAGILAHEWGHMMSDLPKGVDWSNLNWNELLELRRSEEAKADAWAGRLLFKMGKSVKKMIKFIGDINQNKKIKTHKYHSPETRKEIIKQAYEQELRQSEWAKKLFSSSVYKSPNASQFITEA